MDQKFLIVGDSNVRLGQEDPEGAEGRKRRSQDTILNQEEKIEEETIGEGTMWKYMAGTRE